MQNEKERRTPSRVSQTVAYGTVTSLFLILIYVAASGPRGSDQFWYLADTTTLLEGGPPLTNCVFPGPLLRGDVPLDRTYFVHHSPLMYVVLPFASLAGPYYGWIAFNILVVLTAAALIALTLHRLTSPGIALTAYTVFLLLPLTIWQAGNLLQEAGLALVTAALVVLYTFTERNPLAWGVLLVASVVAVSFHPLYLPLAIALPLLFLWRNRKHIRIRHIGLALSALAAASSIQVNRRAWFPSTLQPTMSAIIAGTVPGEGNMEWHFRSEPPEVTPNLVLSKAKEAVARQVSLSRTGVFYWPANLMIVGSVLLLFRRKGDADTRQLARATGVLVALFAALVLLHQNQYRYLLIITPAILMSSAVYLQRVHPALLHRRATHVTLALLFAGFLTVDAVIARQLRVEGLSAASAIEHVRSHTADLTAGQRVVVNGKFVGEMLPLSFALRPRPCLLLLEDRLSDQTVQRLFGRFDPQLVICRSDAKLRRLLGPHWTEADWSVPESQFVVYVPR